MKLKILTVSDIHLGHGRNSTTSIIEALNKNLIQHPDFPSIDVLFIAGDLFDGLLPQTSSDRAEVFIWFVGLVNQCEKHDIVLRLLEGTPSHDWKQSEILPTVKTIASSNADFKYVKALSIEHFDRFDIDVLYVPDEWRPKNEETLEQVKELLKSKGLEQVDYAVMHGNFEYQLPELAGKVPCHDSAEYLALVKHLIFIGHIHTHSRFERIVAQGSFDRLSHGEEEPKGFVIAEVDHKTNQRDVFFIENVDARIYKTFDVTGMELENALDLLDARTSTYPDNSCIRIRAEKGHPIFSNMEAVMRRAPTLVWTTKPASIEQEQLEKNIRKTNEMYKAITLTKENIKPILFDRPAFKTMSADMMRRAIRHLEEAL